MSKLGKMEQKRTVLFVCNHGQVFSPFFESRFERHIHTLGLKNECEVSHAGVSNDDFPEKLRQYDYIVPVDEGIRDDVLTAIRKTKPEPSPRVITLQVEEKNWQDLLLEAIKSKA